MPTRNQIERDDELELQDEPEIVQDPIEEPEEDVGVEVDPDQESTLLARAHVLSSVLGGRGGAARPQPLLVIDALEELSKGKVLQPQQANAIRDYAGAIIQIMDNERSFLIFRSLLEKVNL